MLRRSPGFTISALAILTLGIGANTAIFSVVNAVLLRPLPFPNSDSIVTVFHVPPPRAFPGMSIFAVSAANYLDWRKENNVFESIAVAGFRMLQLGGGGRPEGVIATATEPDFFTVLRVAPAAGRAFSWDECQPGRDTVIVVSDGFASRHFGSARNAVGRRLELSGRKYQVIGVMPPDFQVRSWFPAATDAWIPLAWTAQDRAVRGNHNYLVVARLRPGVTVQKAQSQMNVISERLARAYPEENTGWGAIVTPLRDHIVGDVRPALLTLLGAVGFVLLIACANTANLVLARTIGRRKELAIRAALGASAGQVIRPVLVETTLLSLAGGALGLLLAHSGQKLVIGALAGQMPRAIDVDVDGVVLAFTVAASMFTGLVAGCIGAWQLMRADLNDSLKQGSGKTDSDSGRSRTRSALVVSEVALSLMLLMGAGLMIRTFSALRRVNPGFDPSNTISMTVPIPESSHPGARTKFYDEFLARVRTLPGVVSAGAIDTLPLQGGGSQQPVVIQGRPAEVFALQPNVSVRRASPGYMQTMRIPLLAGRDFTDADTTGNQPAILVSQSMATKFWPGENPIGKRLTISFTPEITREVVGVVGDVKDRGVDVLESVAMLYVPLLDTETHPVSLVVRSDGDPSRVVPAVTRVLQQINPELPVRDVEELDHLIAASLSQYRFGMFLFGALAALALLLAAVGIFSVLAYNVRRRVQEIGIRMALGAHVWDVVRMVVVEGMRPTAAGIAIGIFGAFTVSGILSKLIYGVSATDPYTFASVAGVLAFVALAACAVPAYKATRVDPARALRNE